jgi:hypothetical protein
MINHVDVGHGCWARNPMASVYQFIFAVIMSMTFLKTQSLRWRLPLISG